jgi:hypothetical protein
MSGFVRTKKRDGDGARFDYSMQSGIPHAAENLPA